MIDDATFAIEENSAATTTVGTVVASDVDGPATTFSITDGNADGQFTIDSTTGQITVAGSLDFETTSVYTLTVEASDGDLSDTAAVTIDIVDLNEGPMVTVTGTVISLAEDTDVSSRIKVADIAVVDDGLGTNILGLSGGDAALFEIDGNELFLIAGAGLDFETNPALDVTVTVNDGTSTDSDAITIAITDVSEDETGPRVTGVRVNSTAWDGTFRDFVDGGLGDSALGYVIPNGSDQLEILPWLNINQVLVTFNEDVSASLSAEDLTLDVTVGVHADGTTGRVPNVIAVEWNAAELTATFTLNQSIEPARIELQIDSANVTDSAGNELDGEFTNGQASNLSGDSLAGGDFRFNINVLPADVVRPSDEVVGTEDAEVIQANPGLLMPGVGPILLYDSFNDLNGDGVVNGLDVQSAVTRNTSRLLNASAPAAVSFAINAPDADSFASRAAAAVSAASNAADADSFANRAAAAVSAASNAAAADSFASRAAAAVSAASNADSVGSIEQPTVLRSSGIPESVSSQVSLAGSQDAHEKADRASGSQVNGKQVETNAESFNESVDSVFEDFLDQGFEII